MEDHVPYEVPPPTSNEANHPYADLGEATGEHAYLLLDALCQPLTGEGYDEHGWHDADSDALSALGEFEFLLPHIRATDEVSLEEMIDFDTKIAALHLALPFTEAERNLLVRTNRGLIEVQYRHLVEQFASASGEVIHAGKRSLIDGQELLWRWAAWRHQSGEYAGQGTLDIARETLRGIVRLLAPGEPLPDSYRQLRGISKVSN